MDSNPALPLPRPSRMATALLLLGALLALTPLVSAAIALIVGAAIALVFGNPIHTQTHTWTHRLLPLAVVGLGAEMNLGTVARVGLHGLGYTAISLSLVMGLGLLLGRYLKVDRDAGLLISIGTAICGGSAIAAAAPVLRARPHQVSVALATVFLLNAVALVVFPPIGHMAHLGQEPFGLWAALAIHDIHPCNEAISSPNPMRTGRAGDGVLNGIARGFCRLPCRGRGPEGGPADGGKFRGEVGI